MKASTLQIHPTDLLNMVVIDRPNFEANWLSPLGATDSSVAAAADSGDSNKAISTKNTDMHLHGGPYGQAQGIKGALYSVSHPDSSLEATPAPPPAVAILDALPPPALPD